MSGGSSELLSVPLIVIWLPVMPISVRSGGGSRAGDGLGDDPEGRFDAPQHEREIHYFKRR